MQNQAISGQNSLQQTGSNLQQYSSNLQQSGAPALSSDVFTVLSQNSSTEGLRVQSAQTDPTAQSQTYQPEVPPTAWLVPAFFLLSAIAAIVLWARFRTQIEQAGEEFIEQTEPIILEKPAAAVVKAKTKSGKKTTRRKRQTKR